MLWTNEAIITNSFAKITLHPNHINVEERIFVNNVGILRAFVNRMGVLLKFSQRTKKTMSLSTSAIHRKMSPISMMIFLHSQENAFFGKQMNGNVHNSVIDSSQYRRWTRIMVDYGHWSTFLRKDERNDWINRNIHFHCKSKQIIQNRCDAWMWMTIWCVTGISKLFIQLNETEAANGMWSNSYECVFYGNTVDIPFSITVFLKAFKFRSLE